MRLFIGLPLPRDARQGAAALAARAAEVIPGRYALVENYHITLAFLGEAPPEDVPRIAAVLARCLSCAPAPLLSPGQPGIFGRMENGILVLHMASQPALEPLHDALCAALRSEGLPVSDGPFTPHVTLARHARASPEALRALTARAAGIPCFRADCASLFLSARDERGVLRYTVLCSFPFSYPCSSSFSSSFPAFDRSL